MSLVTPNDLVAIFMGPDVIAQPVCKLLKLEDHILYSYVYV